MSKAEEDFLGRMRREKLAAQRQHCEQIRAQNGACACLNCADCPLDCAMTDDITLRKAEEWLATNP
jgi:hypothetical protein